MLLLTAHQLVRYLIRHKHADRQEAPILRTQNVSSERSQNQCFLAYWEAGRWFIKQPYFPDRYDTFGIANEARFYQLLNHPSDLHDLLTQHAPALKGLIAPLIGFDARNRILLLGYLSEFRAASIAPFPDGVDLLKSDLPEQAAQVLRQVHWPLQSDIRNHQLQYFIAFRPLLLRNRASFIPQLLDSNVKSRGMFLSELKYQLTEKQVMDSLHHLSDEVWQ
ncbi:MAG: hypothetical protein LH606_10465, partial [Cytophagaceae bacterium]|nr:hypothetical protein [Cytophagaceae bacterium]